MSDAKVPNNQGNPAAAIPVYTVAAPTGTAITTSTSTAIVASGWGQFYGLNVNTPQDGATAAVYDGADDTGVSLGTFDLSIPGPSGIPVQVHNGLTVITAGLTTGSVTVFSR